MSDVTIPEGIREQARWVYDRLGHGSTADEDTIARAMAVAVKTEQERCAKIADREAEERQAVAPLLDGKARTVAIGQASVASGVAQAIRSSHD